MKTKAGGSSRTPNIVIYENNYSTNYRFVNRKNIYGKFYSSGDLRLRSCLDVIQRRWSRSKSTETGSPSGGITWIAAESEGTDAARKSNSTVAPVMEHGTRRRQS